MTQRDRNGHSSGGRNTLTTTVMVSFGNSTLPITWDINFQLPGKRISVRDYLHWVGLWACLPEDSLD